VSDRPATPRLVSRFRVPDLGVGAGYRAGHYAAIDAGAPDIDWFEVLSENHMVDGGGPLHWLDKVRARWPVVQHGVSMSLGSDEDPEHTRRLVALTRRTGSPWVSDHVCFTHAGGVNSHDLLPVPYTRDVLRHMVDRCRRMTDALGVPLVVENPSSYLGWRASELPEWAFISELCEAADVGLLLDVNNVFVSSVNHGFDPLEWLNNVPADRVVQIHLAGHTIRDGYRLDTHDHPVCDEVWDLYAHVIRRVGSVSTLIEWDDKLPSLDRLVEEVQRARAVRDAALAERADG
jgi:uncharacterized protein (UPF0276 family)